MTHAAASAPATHREHKSRPLSDCRSRALLAFVALLVSLAVLDRRTQAEATRPNFVVFIADDHGYTDLGCYGNGSIATPNIDRLAASGCRFTRAFLTTSSCSPSRCSILTGRYPHSTGAEDLHAPLPERARTVAWYLRAAGYHISAAGKWHLGDPERRNWDLIEECGGHDTAARAIKALRSRPQDRPFFLWVASVDPHRPFDADATPEPPMPEHVRVPPYLPDRVEIRRELAAYYGEVQRFDRHVGEVTAELQRQGVLDTTCVVYLSDNGMPFPRAKTTLYDSGIRTPLILRYPPLLEAGSEYHGLVSAIDLAPTILELAGVHATTPQGRSLLPALKNSDITHRQAVFAEANWHDFEQFSRAVRTERYLLVRNYYYDRPLWNSVDSINSPTWAAVLDEREQGRLTPAQLFLFQEPRPFEELYDLQLDPSSLASVAHRQTYRDTYARLRTLLDNWRVETADAMPTQRRRDGWTRDGRPLPHNQPWYDRWKKRGRTDFNRFAR